MGRIRAFVLALMLAAGASAVVVQPAGAFVCHEGSCDCSIEVKGKTIVPCQT